MRAPRAGLALVMAAATAITAPRSDEPRQPSPQPAPSSAQADFPALEAVERDIARLIDMARPSVVGIIARSRLEPLLDALGDNVKIEGDTGGGGPIARRIGSGIVLDSLGHVVTLGSVVAGATDLTVLTTNGERLRARLKGVDDYSGIAVLELEAGGSGHVLLPVTFGDSDALKIGALVTAFSSPTGNHGKDPAYSLGFVSGVGISQGPARRCSYIKFSAYAPPGAGGGAVLDSRGRLVGLLFGAGGASRRRGEDLIQWDQPSVSDDQDPEISVIEQPPGQGPDKSIWILKSLKRAGATGASVAFAVPANVVRRASEQIIHSGTTRRGWVGVKIEESEPGEVRLLEVVRGGPAEKAGLQPEDRIVSFNDASLATAGPLLDGVASAAPGTNVKLGIERDGRRFDVSIRLGEAPASQTRTPRAPQPPPVMRYRPPALGIDVDTDTDDQMRSHLGAPEGVGLLVQTVREDSRAEQAGMESGDLLLEALGQQIRSLDDLRRALIQQGPREMDVKVIRDGRTMILRIPPPPLSEAPTPPPAPPAAPRRHP